MTSAPISAGVTTDDGVRLSIQIHGSADGLPVVLVHGYTGGTVDWDPVIPGLALDHTVITYDHRGHGVSDRGAADSYTISQLVSDLGAVTDWVRAERGCSQAHLVGHSLGGVVAMLYAVAHQDGIASLVLTDTAGAAEFGVPDQVAEIAAVGREAGMEVVAQLVISFLRNNDDAPDFSDKVAGQMAAKLAATDVEAFDALARELNSFPPIEGLDTLAIPTTVVVGERDTNLREPAARLAAVIPDATLVVIPAAGHSPQDDAPEAVLEALRHHLKEKDLL